MPQIWRNADINAREISPERIAVIGFGSQGRAQALNLRDSRADLRIGLRDDSPNRIEAESQGLSVMSPQDACANADVVALMTPDEAMPEVVSSLPWHAGQAALFAHGFAVVYQMVEMPEDVDVILLSPKGVGPGVRRQYVEGHGVPGLAAVERDATGRAWDRVLAYGQGIGCGRAAIFQTTFREETETDLFGEQAVLCGGIPEIAQAGYETLVEAGYSPEAAYFECIHEIKLIVDLLYEKGLSGMRAKISDTAEWGGYQSGERIVDDATRQKMREVLADIQSGDFARGWIAEAKERKRLHATRQSKAEHPIEETGRTIRRAIGLEE